MGFLKWPIKNPVFVNMLMILAIVIGLLSLNMMPQELNPEISLNWANITTLYNGASAEDMEKLVTKKIEDAIYDIDNIETITSWSGEGYSRISVKFEDMSDDKFQRLYQELVTEVNSVSLPESAEDPEFFKWSSSTFLPVLNLAVYGNVNELDLKEIAKDLKNQIADLSSISKINISGDRKREIWVELEPEKMTKLKISFEEVQQAIINKNLNVSAGYIKNNNSELMVRVMGEFKSISEIENTVLRYDNNQTVFLRDVSKISQNFQQASTKSKFNGLPSVTLSIYKEPGFGTLKTVEDIKAISQEFNQKLPESIKIDYATDTSYLIKDGLEILNSNALMGIILVLLILKLFMGNRNAIFAAIGIPTSILMTMIFLYMMDYSLNLSVIFGIVLVSGMLVDDAMVIIENVYRYIEKGMKPLDAVVKGVPEVALPVTASVLTTVAAFIPLILMPGIMGKFLRIIPIVVCVALVSSVIEAFFILPVHMAKFAKVNKKISRAEIFMDKLKEFYGKILSQIIIGRTYVIVAVIILFLIGLGMLMDTSVKMALIVLMVLILLITAIISYLTSHFKKRFFVPLIGLVFVGSILVMFKEKIAVNMFAGEPLNMLFIRVKTPVGYNLDQTEKVMNEFEKAVMKLPDYERKHLITNVGLLNLDTEVLNGSNVGEITVDIVPKKMRVLPETASARSMDEILADVKTFTKDITGVEWVGILYPQDGPPAGKAVEVKIIGDDFQILNEIAHLISDSLKQMKGLQNIDNDFQEGKEEFRFYANDYQMARSGLSNSQVANSLQKILYGQNLAILRDNDEEMFVKLKYPENYYQSKDALQRVRIQNNRGELIPLSSLGEFKSEYSLNTIKHFKRERVVTVSGDLNEEEAKVNNVTGVSVNTKIKDIFNKISASYPGYRISFEGEFKEFESAFSGLLTLFLVGIGLIFVILGTQFNSWIRPLMIMVTIPLAFVGAIFGLAVSDNPFSIGAMYGMVALAGVVVNSAIVLIDFIAHNRKNNMSIFDAVVNASKMRLRPILLTSMSTILGLLPLAVGIGGRDANWQPLAITVVAGLFLSTILTLFVIPSLYIVFEDLIRFFFNSPKVMTVYRIIFIFFALLLFGQLIFVNIIIAITVLIIFLIIAFIFDLEKADTEEYESDDYKKIVN